MDSALAYFHLEMTLSRLNMSSARSHRALRTVIVAAKDKKGKRWKGIKNVLALGLGDHVSLSHGVLSRFSVRYV